MGVVCKGQNESVFVWLPSLWTYHVLVGFEETQCAVCVCVLVCASGRDLHAKLSLYWETMESLSWSIIHESIPSEATAMMFELYLINMMTSWEKRCSRAAFSEGKQHYNSSEILSLIEKVKDCINETFTFHLYLSQTHPDSFSVHLPCCFAATHPFRCWGFLMISLH